MRSEAGGPLTWPAVAESAKFAKAASWLVRARGAERLPQLVTRIDQAERVGELGDAARARLRIDQAERAAWDRLAEADLETAVAGVLNRPLPKGGASIELMLMAASLLFELSTLRMHPARSLQPPGWPPPHQRDQWPAEFADCRRLDVWAWRAAVEADNILQTYAEIDVRGDGVLLAALGGSDVQGRGARLARAWRHPALGAAGRGYLGQLEAAERALLALDAMHEEAALQKMAERLRQQQADGSRDPRLGTSLHEISWSVAYEEAAPRLAVSRRERREWSKLASRFAAR